MGHSEDEVKRGLYLINPSQLLPLSRGEMLSVPIVDALQEIWTGNSHGHARPCSDSTKSLGHINLREFPGHQPGVNRDLPAGVTGISCSLL